MDRKKTASGFRTSLHGLPYDQTTPDQAPIPIATPSSEPTAEQLQVYRTAHPTYVSAKSRLRQEKEGRRDSGLAGSSLRDSGTTVTTEDLSAGSLKSAPGVAQIQKENGLNLVPSSRRGEKVWLGFQPTKSITEPALLEDSFRGIALDIPTGDLEDDLQPDKMEFSKRGSMLIRGSRANEGPRPADCRLHPEFQGRPAESNPSRRKRPAPKILSADEKLLSRKVRSYYDSGVESLDDVDRKSLSDQHTSQKSQDAGGSWDDVSMQHPMSDAVNDHSTAGRTSQQPLQRASQREELELAGGLEDWQDVESGHVDRYGFIMPRTSTVSSTNGAGMKRSPSCRDPPALQRISTSLQLAAEAPRRKHTIRRAPSSAHSTKSATPRKGSNRQPKAWITRPASSQSSYQSRVPGGNSRLRQAANRLPQNRDRRFVDEAGDMLTQPVCLADTAESGGTEGKETHARRKEVDREEKWRKMARVVSSRRDGGGTRFEFDVGSTKLIERTWKGIPDRWRATAWHAFLSASAKRSENSLADGELIEMFHQHQFEASPDDVQIDIDVPRTISSHIMFRRRYRGGQRLLFRVLHAMSLHFPGTGYVQGMAALAATLLAYYDEENAFVMLVRLWELRGLDKLYRSGFEGLMEALDDFEKKWLDGGEIWAKLVGQAIQQHVGPTNDSEQTDLGIPPTSYGTRWYLTLFNYSIPFPAQLRVWDVFMLLGDTGGTPARNSTAHSGAFGSTLDVLHASSAALIDGTRDILLDSDFENAMKVLTSWIPIQDEDLFMRVAKAEWKMHYRKA